MLRVQTSLLAILAGVLVLGVLTIASPATAQTRGTGLMFKVAQPVDELSNTHETGFGLSAVVRSQVEGSRTWFHGQASFLSFGGKEVELPSATERFDSAEIFGLSMGVMAGLTQRLYVGCEGGYFFGDSHGWDVVPFVSIISGNWEVMGEYKLLGEANWWGISLGYYLF